MTRLEVFESFNIHPIGEEFDTKTPTENFCAWSACRGNNPPMRHIENSTFSRVRRVKGRAEVEVKNTRDVYTKACRKR